MKLNGHGKLTVPLYARPDFAAAIAGIGVSGEVLDKLSCWSGASIEWSPMSNTSASRRQ